MLAVVVTACAIVVALPFLLHLQRGWRAVRCAAHFRLLPLAASATTPESSAMRAATSALSVRTLHPPLVVLHRYRRHGAVATGLTVVGRHPERIAALVAHAARAVAEPVEHLDLPAGAVLRCGRRTRRPVMGDNDVGPDAFDRWVTSVLADAPADAVLSIGVTPATRWETLRPTATAALAGWRGRIVAGAGDPITADALAAGCGTQIPGLSDTLSASRPGDAAVVAGAAALAVLTGAIVAVRALVNLHLGAALAAMEAGSLGALALGAVGGTGILRVTESCWRHWQYCGVVMPERPWRLSARRAAVQRRRGDQPPTTRRTVSLTADQWAALCNPGVRAVPEAGVSRLAMDAPSAR
ncbi:MAG: hypothetical protein M3137_20695 [Actinomycetota bacterium]|nr:hypothetical protein [Actinomycetota bacterium]